MQFDYREYESLLYTSVASLTVILVISIIFGLIVGQLCILYKSQVFLLLPQSVRITARQMRRWWNRWQYNSSNVLRACSARIAVGEEVKLALVVRKDLKMGNGKIAAQYAHAAVATVEYMHYLQSQESEQYMSASKSTTTPSSKPYFAPMLSRMFGNSCATASAETSDSVENKANEENRIVEQQWQEEEQNLSGQVLKRKWVQWYNAWLASGQAKIVVQCLNEDELLALEKHAKSLNVYCHIIRDAGRTQIKSGSKTVLSIGPGPKSVIDAITGKLKLL